MKKRFILQFTLLLTVAVFISACGSNVDEPSDKSSTQSSNDEGKEVLRVGATSTGAPFTFLNTETNEIDGVMVDIAETLAEKLEVEVEIHEHQFSSLIPAIESGRIDIISAGMVISEDRKKIIDFSQPVYGYGEGLVVRIDTDDIRTLEDLEGKKVGVQEGTIYLNGLQEDYPEIYSQGYKSTADMLKELENERIEAFLGDYPIIKHMINENPDFEVKLIEEYEPNWVAEIGIGIAKGSDEMLDKINSAIDEMKESGELDSILEKWGL